MCTKRYSVDAVFITAKTAVLLFGCSFVSGCAVNHQATAVAETTVYFSHSYVTVSEKKSESLFKANIERASNLPQQAFRSRNQIVLFFDNDSSELRQSDIEHLQSYLMAFEPRNYPIFMITGHTDNNHSDLYNLQLSERRAKRTQQEMLTMGVPEILITLRAVGEHDPVASNGTPVGRQANRRVTVQAIQ